MCHLNPYITYAEIIIEAIPNGAYGYSGKKYDGLSDFKSRWRQEYSYSPPQSDTVKNYSQKTFSGYDAYYVEDYRDNDLLTRYYWLDFPEFAIIVKMSSGPRGGGEYDWGNEQIDRLLPLLKLHVNSLTGSQTVSQSSDEADYSGNPTNWTTIIGALAAGGAALTAAAAAIAAAARARAKSKTGKDKKDKSQEEEGVAGYILQVSDDHLMMSEDKPAALQATVWKVDMQGGTKRASEAVLEIEAPPGASFLNIAPPRARGRLDASLSLTGAPNVTSLQLTVKGSAGGSGSTAQVTLEFAGETQIELETDENRRTLRADGKDGFYVYARITVEGETDEEALKAAQDSLEFKIEGAGRDWVDHSPPQEIDDWKAIYLRASNPDALRPESPPPGAFEVKVNGEYKGKKLTNRVIIDLLGLPVLKISENYAAFLLGQAETTELKVWIEPPDDQEWEYDFKLMNQSVEVEAHFEDEPESDGQTGIKKLVIAENGVVSDEKTTAENGLYASDTLRIFAALDDLKIHNDVDISIYQEGLFVIPYGRARDGAYHLKADGKKAPVEIDFRLLLWNYETRRLEANREKGLNLNFASLDEDEKTNNMMEVAQLQHRSNGMRFSNMSSEKYLFWTEKELPSDGEVLFVNMQASSELETVDFTLGVETLAIPSYLPREELKRCQHLIDKHAPPGSKAKLQEILDKRAPVLDAEGLYQLRLQLWNIIQSIIQGEGGQGYHDEAVWANRIVTTLEWTKWAGDHCFNAVIAAKMGPKYVPYATFCKEVLIDCLNKCLNEGKTLSDWANGYYDQIWGQLMDVWVHMREIILKRGVEAAKKRAWMKLKEMLENRFVPIPFPGGKVAIPGWLVFKIFYSMGSFINYIFAGLSMYEAARKTTWDVADDAIGDYIMELGMKKGDQTLGKVISDEVYGKDGKSLIGQKYKGVMKDLKDAYNESGYTKSDRTQQKLNELKKANQKFAEERKKNAANSKAANQVRKGTRKENGKLYANKEDVLDIMGDPVAVRSLKDAPRDVQEAFENTRNKIYREHNAKLIRWARKNLPEAKGHKIVVDNFRTPGKGGGSLGTDNDYRLCYEVTRPDGTRMRIEIDRNKWDEESYKIFSESTGGPGKFKTHKEHAQSLQQLATDQYQIEASPDFADQKKVWVDEKGNIIEDTKKWINEHKDNPNKKLKMVTAQVRSNILDVKAGKATLKDAEYLGKMYNIKVGDALHKGSKGDAYAQAKKAVETLREVRTGYSRQGKKIQPLSNEMKIGMQAVEMAAENFNNPEALALAEKTLAENNLGSLTDFTNKIASQFDSVKIADLHDSLKK
ncbi:MAG: hypothetical protein JW908_11620 [Anaerolineales bacterium]|nr:hypothetical protein [Anaerolineales bacterium]